MYIVEGMDGSGKSTLAVQLACDLQGMVIANKRKPQWSKHLVDQIQIAISASAVIPVVLDRFSLISEEVYCRLRTRKFPFFTMLHLWSGMPSNTKVIYVRPPFELLKLDGPQMDGVVSHAEMLYNAYDEVINIVQQHTQIEVITYDRTTMSYDELKELLHA